MLTNEARDALRQYIAEGRFYRDPDFDIDAWVEGDELRVVPNARSNHRHYAMVNRRLERQGRAPHVWHMGAVES